MYSDDDMVLKKHDNSSIVLFILFHSISGISWVAVVLVKEAHWRFKTVCSFSFECKNHFLFLPLKSPSFYFSTFCISEEWWWLI